MKLQTISIQHFKNKVDALLKIYFEIYPEIKISENLPEEIFDLYLKTDNFYHKSKNFYERRGILFAVEL